MRAPEDGQVAGLYRRHGIIWPAIASTWHHGWNENGQLTYLEYRNSSGRVHKFEYSYDDSGNRIQLIDTPLDLAEQLVWDYSYDWLNRLESVTRSRPEASPAVDDIVTVYGYDESDNRTEFTYTEGSNPSVETTYSYNAADEITERMVASVVVETFTHDKDGNMLTRDNGSSTITYGWDHFDRLVSFRQTDPPKRQRYRYDTGNIRKSKSEMDGAQTTYKYGGMAVSNEARTPSGGSPTATAWFGGHQLLGFERGGSFFYLLADGLSSVRTIVTAAGVVAASYNSDEFGNPIQATETSTSSPARFVGALGVRDETGENSLQYMRARFYAPGLGRFINRDPIGVAGGLNLSTYVANNPVNSIDPNGLDTWNGTVSGWGGNVIGVGYQTSQGSLTNVRTGETVRVMVECFSVSGGIAAFISPLIGVTIFGGPKTGSEFGTGWGSTQAFARAGVRFGLPVGIGVSFAGTTDVGAEEHVFSYGVSAPTRSIPMPEGLEFGWSAGARWCRMTVLGIGRAASTCEAPTNTPMMPAGTTLPVSSQRPRRFSLPGPGGGFQH